MSEINRKLKKLAKNNENLRMRALEQGPDALETSYRNYRILYELIYLRIAGHIITLILL